MPTLETGQQFGSLRLGPLLGRGAFASVYRARDEALGREVALKVLAATSISQSGREREHFLEEARLVAELASPHIVTLYRLHDLGAAGFALELEYVEGGSLAARLEQAGRLPLTEVLRVLRGLLEALATAHDHRIIHRDVKPENVLLTRQGEAKLADFGLGKHQGVASLSDEQGVRLRGTPLYMAPEVVMGEAATPAADLWGVGVLAYRMLAGRAAFDAPNLAALFYAIHASEPEPLGADVPAPLRTLVERCLVKDPAQRAGDARELLALMESLAPHASPTPRTAPSRPASAPAAGPVPRSRARLVGRQEEQHLLGRLLAGLERGQGAGLWILGEAGVGKSALRGELVLRAAGLGMHVVEAALPPLGGLQRPLLEAVRRLLGGPEGARALDPAWHGSARSAAEALLSRDPSVLLGRQPAVWALGTVLSALAQARPVVLTVEDAHEGDAEDLRLLAELMRQSADHPVLVAATFRTRDRASSDGTAPADQRLAALRQQPGVRTLDLSPLSPSEVAALIEAGDEPSGTPVVDRLLELSEGNPLFALELVRHMLASGALERGPRGLRAGPSWERMALPERLSELVRQRLGTVDEGDRALLEAACVDGTHIDGEALAAVAGQSLLSVLRTLQRLYRAHGLLVPQADGFRFSHAAIREVLYAGLADELRRAYHAAFARHLASRPPERAPDAERLGVHWERAGLGGEARAWLVRAAHAAALRQEHARAVDLVRRGGLDPLRLSPAQARAHAEVLLLAVHAFMETRQVAEGAAILSALAEGAREAGDTLLADRVLVERSFLDCQARGAAGLDAAALEAAAARLPPSKALGRAHYTLGMHARLTGDLDGAREHLTRAEAVWAEQGLVGSRASALDLLGSVAWRAGHLEQALSYYDRAIQLSRSAGRSIDAAITQVNRAGVLEALERTEGIEAVYAEAVQALSRGGDAERAEHVRTLLAARRLARGDLAGAEELARLALAALRPMGRGPTVATCLRTHAEIVAARGRLEEARALLAEARSVGGGAADLEIAALSDALEACLDAWSGAGAEACARLARLGDDAQLIPRAVVAVAMLVATCALQLRSSDLLEQAQRLADQDAAGGEGVTALLLAAGAALLAPSSAPAALHALAEQASGHARRTGELRTRVLARLLEGEACLRAGETVPARAANEAALDLARSSEDVWWQAALLRWREQRLGDASARDARRALLAPVAASLPEARRGPFLASWGVA